MHFPRSTGLNQLFLVMQARMRRQVRCCWGLKHDWHTRLSRISRPWQMSSADNSSPLARKRCPEWVVVITCCWNSCWCSRLKQLPHQNTAGECDTKQVTGKGAGKGYVVTTVTKSFFIIPKISQKWRRRAAQGATGDRSWYLPLGSQECRYSAASSAALCVQSSK